LIRFKIYFLIWCQSYLDFILRSLFILLGYRIVIKLPIMYIRMHKLTISTWRMYKRFYINKKLRHFILPKWIQTFIRWFYKIKLYYFLIINSKVDILKNKNNYRVLSFILNLKFNVFKPIVVYSFFELEVRWIRWSMNMYIWFWFYFRYKVVCYSPHIYYYDFWMMIVAW